MDNWSYDENSRSGVLSVKEDMTINHISALKQKFVEAFNQAEKVIIDVSATPAVDVAGLQLLSACQRFSIARGKEMRLQLDENKDFIDFMEEVGFSQDFFSINDKTES